MDQHRERIQEDLRGLVAGDVRCDSISLQLYASDGSIHQIKPLGVVRPQSTADVVATVQYAREKQIPIHARGAGSGVAGESLGPGLVVDFSTHMHRVLRLEAEQVRVQPGVVRERLDAQLRRFGRFFGPDPSMKSVTTIGGMIAVGGAGRHWLRYGSVRSHVLGMQIVLADGQMLEVGREPLVAGRSRETDFTKRRLVNRLARLLRDRDELIRQKEPNSPVNRCGYRLGGLVDDEHLDLARLLVGSEGTLALVTEVTLATDPLPKHCGVALLFFDSLEKAARAVPEVLLHRPSACDLMERRYLSLAREMDVEFDLLIPPQTEAALVVEQEGNDLREVRESLRALVEEAGAEKGLAFDARASADPLEVSLFRRLATRVRPALFRMKGLTRPVPVVEDMAVPPEVLPEFLVRVQNVLKRNQVTASLYAHAGQGQLHLQPFLNLAEPSDVETMRRLAAELYEETLSLDGTISGEHACGLSRTPFIRRQVGELYEVFEKVKQIFDPENLLNPGKIVGDDPDLLTRHLRPVARTLAAPAEAAGEDAKDEAMSDLVALQLNWEPALVAEAAQQCNGCGECRWQAPDRRMCPIFRLLPAEEASPRAKANLIRGVLAGQLDLSCLTDDQFKAVADLCVHCHMCPMECPARVDVPKLMALSKGAYVAANGLRLSDWVVIRLDLVAAAASLVRPLANWALANRQARWLLEKTLGIAQGRKLPRIASRTFLRRAAKARLTRPSRVGDRKVAYFVDHYANWHDPQLAESLVAVLQHNGVSVYVPPDQRLSGTAAVALGALDQARELARHNVRILVEAIRQGYHVVASEPAAALCLVREYVDLLDDDDSRLVAENTSEACSYLWRLHTAGQLQLDFKPLQATVAYHMPCRLKALEVGSPGENLLRLIPGLLVRPIEGGCSGMAGAFGLRRENYRSSLRAGRTLISRLRDPAIQAGATECSACKIQMEQGATKPTIHPLKLLASAYGLVTDSAALLTTRSEELIVT